MGKIEEANTLEIVAGMQEVVDQALEETLEDMKVKKPDTLRELTDEDIYPICEIIGKVLPEDMKNSFVQMMSAEKPMESLKEIGIMVAFDLGKLILQNLGSIKDEMYAFLSSLSGIPEEELRKMPLGTTPRMIKDVFQGAKNTYFFKELSEFLS